MDSRDLWFLEQAARKRAQTLGLQEWAEGIAQEAVLIAFTFPELEDEVIIQKAVQNLIDHLNVPETY